MQLPPATEERQIFKDPYAVLAEIATETGVLQNRSAEGAGGSNRAGPSTGAEGGDAYRDPFNPNYWSTHVKDEIFPLTDSPVTPPPSRDSELKPQPEKAVSQAGRVRSTDGGRRTDRRQRSCSR
jgi:chemotaxis protein MotB